MPEMELLKAQAIDYSQLKYDERLGHVMSSAEFEKYKINVGHTYYLFLMNLIHIVKPKNVVELGTSIGRSGLFMMTALPEGSKFTTLEKGSFMRVDLKPFFDDPRLKIVYGDDLDEATYAPLGLKDIDFCFIDTEHEIGHLQKEWAIYKNFLADGAIVVMDDISLNDGMKSFWGELKYEKASCSSDVHFSGFGLFRFVQDPV